LLQILVSQKLINPKLNLYNATISAAIVLTDKHITITFIKVSKREELVKSKIKLDKRENSKN